MKFRNPVLTVFLTALFATVAPAVHLSTALAADPEHPAMDSSMSMGMDMPSADAIQPDWVKQYEAQLAREDDSEGHSGLTDQIDQAMWKVMQEVQKGNKTLPDHDKSGMFNRVSMMQQMDRSFFMGPSTSETVSIPTGGGHCPASAPKKDFDITAINVEITLNQWGDFYPGYMYVLSKNLDKVRAEEAKNAAARDDENDPGGVSNGLQLDYIQPLAIRANQGDCVMITLHNEIEDEEASIHIHGSSMIISSTGQPATSANPDSTVPEHESQVFEWYIPPDEQEGGHMFHSHVGRETSSLGLMGAFMVEPKGSVYLDPLTGKESQSGWQMMITNDNAPDFREFAIFYHEVGDESFRPLQRTGEMIPQRDPNTDSYRPSARALNYRSEPFGVNNLAIQHKYFHFEDESLAYSAYTFGDAPTPIPRSYMGDPAKWRLIHGGGEVFHSHHPHGGTIRWLRQPKADGKSDMILTAGWNGPVKYPVIRTTSDRVDVQVIGPTEEYDLQTECGSGLCQKLAGDFLFHCHVAHHYVSGMWSYWRNYNTLQTGNYPFVSTDVMPPLQELPDRKGRIKLPVTSDKLVGKTVDWYDKKFNITKNSSDWSKDIPDVSIKDWVKMMLPVAGEPGHTSDETGQIMAYDATVWDWVWDGNTAMGEKEVSGKYPWPKYKSPMPGKRPAILFEPKTGRIAWPHMKPHFGKRMPFARHHGPAPWLEPIHMDKSNVAVGHEPGSVGGAGEETTLPAKPGEQGRWSLCPQNAGRKQYTLHFIKTPIRLTKKMTGQDPVVDPIGLIYVIQEQEAEVKANDDMKVPLVYRYNVYDCVDVILKSEWEDDDVTNFQMSKINIHPHFIQFDNQASDGVISGFSYEQSVRPFTEFTKKMEGGHPVKLPMPMNAKLTDKAKAGSSSIEIKMAEGATAYHEGNELMIGMAQPDTVEVRRIKAIKGDEIYFTEPLKNAHAKGEIVSVEYVRYRYWGDSDVGTVFWHDHAFGATTWPHGGVGAMIVEPVGSTYHDPTTGKEIRSGTIADIHTTEPIGYGVNGSFREAVFMPWDTLPSTAQLVTAGNPPGQPLEVALASGQTISFQMPDSLLKVADPYLNGGTHTTGGGFNMRADSLARRIKNNPDPSKLFSSLVHGDPNTPLLRAYLGDTLVFRLLHPAMNESHVFHVSGHTFRTERYAKDSDQKNSYHVGIAERYDLVSHAGGYQKMAGDYIYFNGRASHFSEGSWGIIRVLDEPTKDLQPLPGFEEIPKSAKSVCPEDAPVKTFSVIAANRALKFNPKTEDVIEVDFERKLMLANQEGKIYMLEGEKSKVADGGFQPMPLTLHVNVGDCIKVKLKNEMKASRASFSADMLAFDPKDSQGLNVGNNPGDQTIGPGESRTYTYYAHPALGQTAALVWDWGNVLKNVRDGLFGAIIVGPKGSKYRDPVTGQDVSQENSWNVDVLVDRDLPENAELANYRDASLYFQEEDNIMSTSFMPYLQQVAGLTGVNYRAEPWSYREDEGCEYGNMFTPCVADETDPATPVIQAHAGDAVRIHVFGAFDEQNQVFSLENHEWPLKPDMKGADMLGSAQFGGSENLDVRVTAGGPFHIPGTYVWQNHRLQYAQAGQWGYFRVLPTGDQRILPLSTGPASRTAGTGQEQSGVKPVSTR